MLVDGGQVPGMWALVVLHLGSHWRGLRYLLGNVWGHWR